MIALALFVTVAAVLFTFWFGIRKVGNYLLAVAFTTPLMACVYGLIQETNPLTDRFFFFREGLFLALLFILPIVYIPSPDEYDSEIAGVFMADDEDDEDDDDEDGEGERVLLA